MTLARIAGLSAPLVYLVAVLAGGAVTPGYNHLAMPISALLAGGGGPWWLSGLFVAYNLLLLVFAWNCRRRLLRWTLVASALVGIGMLALPMDTPGTPLSPAGLGHLMLAGLASLLSMLAIGAGAATLPSRASWAVLALVFVSGGLAAIGTAQAWSMAGLLERATIGLFLGWVFWLAWRHPAA